MAKASGRVWYAWVLRGLHAARARLAAVSLLLLAALAAGAGMLWIFGELVDEVFEGDTRAFDDGVLMFLRGFQSPAADRAATIASFMGVEMVLVLLVALLVWFAWTRRWGAAVMLLLVTGGASLLNDVLKLSFQRPRPAPVLDRFSTLIPGQTWSFPSGHAMVSAAFYFFLAYLSWRVLTGWRQALLTTGILVLVLLIGLSRLYLGVHYLTDVIAGYCAGAVWTEAVILGQRYLAWRRRPPATTAAETVELGSPVTPRSVSSAA